MSYDMKLITDHSAMHIPPEKNWVEVRFYYPDGDKPFIDAMTFMEDLGYWVATNGAFSPTKMSMAQVEGPDQVVYSPKPVDPGGFYQAPETAHLLMMPELRKIPWFELLDHVTHLTSNFIYSNHTLPLDLANLAMWQAGRQAISMERRLLIARLLDLLEQRQAEAL